MWPTQRLELLIGILLQFSICAPPSCLALDIQPGAATERLVLHDRLPGSCRWSFCDFKLLHQSRSNPPTCPTMFLCARLQLLTRETEISFCALASPPASPARAICPSKHKLLVIWKHHAPGNVCMRFVCPPEISQCLDGPSTAQGWQHVWHSRRLRGEGLGMLPNIL